MGVDLFLYDFALYKSVTFVQVGTILSGHHTAGNNPMARK